MNFFTLKNKAGMSAVISDFGAVIAELKVPDRNGNFRDVALGYADREDYRTNPYHFGALVGRYANRIRAGRFTLDGIAHRLPRNNENGDCIHGGIRGFHLRQFTAERAAADTLVLARTSPDGEEGFPGALSLHVEYTVTERNSLRIVYRAETDSPTVLNLTNHCYFNLEGRGTIGNHSVRIAASSMLECGNGGIPSGRILSVEGTVFDFRKAKTPGGILKKNPPELARFGGYDVIFPLDDPAHAAEISAPESGIVMTVSTTEPALGFYTANHLDGRLAGKGGVPCAPFSGLCLEAEHFPDSPNHPEFPSTVLRPGEQYLQETEYSFRA